MGLFDYEVCASQRGFDYGSLDVDCLTCKLRHCLPPFALLAPGDTGNFECNETTMFKLQTVSSIQSQFVRHETGWNERLLPIYLVEGKYELATSCEFLATSREYDESRAVELIILFSRLGELIVPPLSPFSILISFATTISRLIFWKQRSPIMKMIDFQL